MSLSGTVPYKIYRPLALNASGAGVNVEELAGTRTLTFLDEQFQNLDPGGAHRDVALPTPDVEHRGCFFCFYNSANAAENLVVKSGVTTIVTLGQGESAIVASTATAWKVAVAMPASAALVGTANTWDLLQTFTVGVRIVDSGVIGFGTAGGDILFTADGTDVIVTGTGDFVFNDSVDLKFGTGKDIGFAWDGTRFNITQAAPNSEIRVGVDGAGIDVRLYGDTAGEAYLWDQSADAVVMTAAVSITGQGSTVVPLIPIAAQQTLVAGGGAITITEYYTAGASDAGGDAWTLANGAQKGQLKKIQLVTDGGGDAVLTPTSLSGGTTITFADAGDFAVLCWSGTAWVAIELGNAADGATAPVLA